MNNHASLDDRALIARTSAGDRRACDVLVTRHRDAVFRWARSFTQSEDAAEDVLQETFLAAYRYAAGFEGRSSVKTWLMTIARNHARRRHRRPEPEVMSEPSLESCRASAIKFP